MGQCITVVFLHVALLMLDLPARASDAHDLGTIIASDLQVGTPGIMIELLA
jgi:hypothetical protein